MMAMEARIVPEQPPGGVEYRRWLAEWGDAEDVRRHYQPEPATQEESRVIRRGSRIQPRLSHRDWLEREVEIWATDFAGRVEPRIIDRLVPVLTAWALAWDTFAVMPELDGLDPWQWFLERLALKGCDPAWQELYALDDYHDQRPTIGDLEARSTDTRRFENKRRLWRLSGEWVDDEGMTSAELYKLLVGVERCVGKWRTKEK